MKIVAKAAKLKRVRVLKGYTQRDLAKKTELSYGFISQIEQGASCSPRVAKKIAEVLSVKLEDVFLLVDTHHDEMAHNSENTA